MPVNNLKLLILDVDGVMTNGKKMYDHTGKAIAKEFSDLDFTAIKLFKIQGVDVLWLTGDRYNKFLANNRDIDCLITKGVNKVTKLDDIMNIYTTTQSRLVTLEDMIYVGDDIFDLDIMMKIMDHGGMAYCTHESPNVLKTKFIPLGYAGDNLVLKLYEMHFGTDVLTSGDMNELYGIPRNESN